MAPVSGAGGRRKRSGPCSFGYEQEQAYHSLAQTKNDHLVISRLPQSAALFVFATVRCNVLAWGAAGRRSHDKRPRVVSSNPVTWDIYEARHTPAKWLGTVEAATADEAIEVAAKEFGIEAKRLIAVRR